MLLAAGSGRRMGRPKALVRAPDGEPWVSRAAGVLRSAGCRPVVVCLGASAEDARALVPRWAAVVDVPDWESGIAASLRAALTHLAGLDATAALVTLVDMPDQQVAAAERVAAAPERTSLRRAWYDGQPGHPVLIGADHWGPLSAALVGDQGAMAYLRDHGAEAVDCTDLGGGQDIDYFPG